VASQEWLKLARASHAQTTARERAGA